MIRADQIPDEVVEAAARAIYHAWCAFHGVTKTSMPWDEVWGEERQACIAEARAAVAVALEEAAKVAEGMWWQGRSNLTTAPYAAAKEVGDEIAAAIRALVKQSTTEEGSA